MVFADHNARMSANVVAGDIVLICAPVNFKLSRPATVADNPNAVFNVSNDTLAL